MSRHVVMSQHLPEFRLKRGPTSLIEIDSSPFHDDDEEFNSSDTQPLPPLPRVTFYPYPTQIRSPSDEGIALFSPIPIYPASPTSDSDESLLSEFLPEDDAESNTSEESESSSPLHCTDFTAFPSFHRTLIPNWTTPPTRVSYFEHLKKQAAEAKRREAERWLEKYRQALAEAILYRVRRVPKQPALYRMSFGMEGRRSYVQSPLTQEIVSF